MSYRNWNKILKEAVRKHQQSQFGKRLDRLARVSNVWWTLRPHGVGRGGASPKYRAPKADEVLQTVLGFHGRRVPFGLSTRCEARWFRVNHRSNESPAPDKNSKLSKSAKPNTYNTSKADKTGAVIDPITMKRIPKQDVYEEEHAPMAKKVRNIPGVDGSPGPQDVVDMDTAAAETEEHSPKLRFTQKDQRRSSPPDSVKPTVVEEQKLHEDTHSPLPSSKPFVSKDERTVKDNLVDSRDVDRDTGRAGSGSLDPKDTLSSSTNKVDSEGNKQKRGPKIEAETFAEQPEKVLKSDLSTNDHDKIVDSQTVNKKGEGSSAKAQFNNVKIDGNVFSAKQPSINTEKLADGGRHQNVGSTKLDPTRDLLPRLDGGQQADAKRPSVREQAEQEKIKAQWVNSFQSPPRPRNSQKPAEAQNVNPQSVNQLEDALRRLQDLEKKRQDEHFRVQKAYEYSIESQSRRPKTLDAKNFFTSTKYDGKKQQEEYAKEYAILTPNLRLIRTRTLPFDSTPPSDMFNALSSMADPGKYVRSISRLEKAGWKCIGGGGPRELLVFQRKYSPAREYTRKVVKIVGSFVGLIGGGVVLMLMLV